jgi:dipeptidyl aminopeptidase/acylaminoacyl peptidase
MSFSSTQGLDALLTHGGFSAMQRLTRIAYCCLVFCFAVWPAPLPAADAPAPQPLKMRDVLAWKRIAGATLSRDGQWLAYTLAPNEGDSEVVLRKTQGDKELRFPCGGGGFAGTAFSHDSKWLAFRVQPSAKEMKLLQKQGKPPRGKVVLVNLANEAKTEFDNVQRFAFSGESAGYIALHKPPAPPAPMATDKWSGADLILRELATGSELNTGNVSEFAFDKKGTMLAMVIDAQGKSGNGVQLRNLAAATVVSLDTAKANYSRLSWTEKGDGLTVLRGEEDKTLQDKLYSIVAFTDLNAKTPKKVVYDPRTDKTFPAGRAISANRPPAWSEDLTLMIFGIHTPKKKPGAPKPVVADAPKPKDGDKPGPKPVVQSPVREKPDVVIWHGSDERLQSAQQKSAGMDQSHNYVCIYRVADKKFMRLADPTLRTVTVAPKQRYAIGIDRRAYQRDETLHGRMYQDVYVIDLKSGERKLALKKNRWMFGASPDGTHLLYYEDGHYYTYEFATGKTYNLTRDVAASFVNDEDDHNVKQPPRFSLGWTKDGVSVLLSDGWDVWNVPVHGGKGINLTVNGKKEGIRYQYRIALDREEKGIDLSGSTYFAMYGEWTKKAGIARVDGGQPGAERLLWDDAAFGSLMKAKNADVFLYTRETHKDYPDFYVADKNLRDGKRLTRANPQQDKFLWSKGVKLVDYTSTKGAKLQGALYLPANYEPNKRYPTIVYIYERLSQGLNRYHMPTLSGGGFSPAVYTSNGYAVFMPDIKYQLNDPGMSAVWCVLPALEAAIATGVVDRDRVGLHGHSWGGYQTAFLITQTDAFKCAVAGAPLTNLISMYNSIYWNIGMANQPIFESSQGRFTGGYWDNLEAYMRNSPVYHAKKVKTPLLLLHNDKDGAVDWNQGIEFFNTLRRLRKPVIMLQYKGENHGLVKSANRKDYTVRMREFFDHHLKGAPARAWLEKGIPHLEMDAHLEKRAQELGD